MQAIDRRNALRAVLCGGAVAAAGLVLTWDELESAPLALEKDLAKKTENLVEEAGWRRWRRRRWVCWWSRGRRVCGWRWV
jgi:hypothetical protein